MSERERSTKQSVKQRVKRGGRKTAKERSPKERVLARWPKAEAWLGVNGAVIKSGPRFLSNYYGKFTWSQAWQDAAKRLRGER